MFTRKPMPVIHITLPAVILLLSAGLVVVPLAGASHGQQPVVAPSVEESPAQQPSESSSSSPERFTGALTVRQKDGSLYYRIYVLRGKVIGGYDTWRGSSTYYYQIVGGWYDGHRMVLLIQSTQDDFGDKWYAHAHHFEKDEDRFILQHTLYGFGKTIETGEVYTPHVTDDITELPADEVQRLAASSAQESSAPEDLPHATVDTEEGVSPRADYEQTIHEAGQEYVHAVQRARTQYIERLDEAMREATRAGDLDRALELRAEKQKQQGQQKVIPNPLAVLPSQERAEQNLRVEPTPPIPLSAETLTARPWYVFHRTGTGRPEKVIQLEPGGRLRFLEGAEFSDWDEKQATWKYEDGQLLLPARTGVLGPFEAVHTVIFRSREEAPHRFFWIPQDIHDPLRTPAAARDR